MFLNAAEAYGVPHASLFQTVDLYEARNMAQVLNTLLQLGTEVTELVHNFVFSKFHLFVCLFVHLFCFINLPFELVEENVV